jgi:hypothetical protein
MSKLPPFGKYLYCLLSEDKSPVNDVYIFIGNKAWEKAKGFQVIRPTTMCLPITNEPDDFQWPVINCDVLLFDTSLSSEKRIEKLAACLFRDRANIVRYISVDYQLNVFNKDF